MPTPMSTRIVLASYPSGLPSIEDFRMETAAVGEVLEGEVLLETRFVSVDANMRGHDPELGFGHSPLLVGGIIEADGTAKVLASKHPEFRSGDIVMARTGWQSHLRHPGSLVHHIPTSLLREEIALITHGTAAMTAYAGLTYSASYKAGETLVVPAANGLLGAMVGQFARMAGLWTVGIVSSDREVSFIKEKLGFHSALNHTLPGFEDDLTQVCAAGIDIFYETIGGALWRSVRPLMNDYGRVVLAGSWFQYSHALGGAAEYGSVATVEALLRKGLSIGTPKVAELRFDDFSREVVRGNVEGSIWSHVRVEEGLLKAPTAWLTAIDGPERNITVIRI